ncbi:MAG: NAD-dependent epimerase/dehydratase family protein [Gemmatimonadales bacterium]
MKVLVTGATGFVGGHLVDRLLARGDTVTALVRSAAGAERLAAHGVRVVRGDLADTAALEQAAESQDVVYHAAARLDSVGEAELMEANREGTRNVARAAGRAGTTARVVLVSSMAAGGPARRGAPKASPGDDRPVTWYGRSKLASEAVLAEAGVPWVALRASVVYGPGDRGLLPLFRSVRFGIAPTFGDGSMEVSLIHVADLVDAMIAAATSDAVVSRAWYVNHPEPITGAALIATIARLSGRRALPLPIPRPAAQAALAFTGAWSRLTGQRSILHPDKVHEFYQEAWTADPSPFMTATGWRPAWELEHGLADTLAWYRANKWL